MAPRGLLAIWTDVDPAAEADFNAWYDDEHLAERVAVPGFLNGRRFVALGADSRPKYFAWYETETPDVLGSAAYGERQANPTPWTARIMPRFRNVTRVVAERLAKSGGGLGAAVATLTLRPAPGREGPLATALIEATASLAAHGPAVIHVQAWRPGGADAAAGTTEAELRAAEENPPAWGILLEATTPETALAALAATDAVAVIEAAAAAPADQNVYRLLLARGAV